MAAFRRRYRSLDGTTNLARHGVRNRVALLLVHHITRSFSARRQAEPHSRTQHARLIWRVARLKTPTLDSHLHRLAQTPLPVMALT